MTSVSPCNASNDDLFGPQVVGCRDDFDFTLLFQQSILSVIPSALLLLYVPYRALHLVKQDHKTRGHSLRYAKIAVCCLLLAQQLVSVIFWALPVAPRVRSAVPSAVLSLTDSLALCLLSMLEHSRSPKTSDALNVYLFFSGSFGAVQARTLWLLGDSVSLASLFTAGVALKFTLLLLEACGKDSILEASYRSLPLESLSGIFSRRLFWWLNELFVQGYRSLLSIDSLYPVDKDLSSTRYAQVVLIGIANTRGKSCSLLKACFFVFKWPALSAVLPRLSLIGFKYAQPFLIDAVTQLVAVPRTGATVNKSYGLIGATLLIYTGIAISTGYYQHKTFRLVTMLRGGLVSLIYSKTMEIGGPQAKEKAPATLMSTDVDTIAASLPGLHELWAGPVEVAVAIWLLERQIGVACVVSVICVAGSVATVCVVKHMIPRQVQWNQAVQERVAVTSKALGSIKSIKLTGMSDKVSQMIQARRVHELELSKRFRIFAVVVNMIASFPSLVSPAITFAVFIAIQRGSSPEGLTVARAFTSLSLINLLYGSLSALIGIFAMLGASLGSFRRIEEFLRSATLELCWEPFQGTRHAPEDTTASSSHSPPETTEPPVPAFHMSHANLGSKDTGAPILVDVSADIPRRKFTVVSGPVGCGKSTLLRALAGEEVCSVGAVQFADDEIAYCQQEPWVQNRTMRANICGESEYWIER